MQEQADQAPKKEQEEVERIMRQYFKNLTGDDLVADMMMRSMAEVLTKGAKLVHINDIVFLVLVKGKGLVEFQAMYEKDSPDELAKAIKKLATYLKAINTKILYTTDEDDSMPKAVQKTRLPWKTETVKLPDGEVHKGYYLKVA